MTAYFFICLFVCFGVLLYSPVWPNSKPGEESPFSVFLGAEITGWDCYAHPNFFDLYVMTLFFYRN